jgi:hypothetical protein
MLIVLFPFLCYDKQISSLCHSHSAYNISLYIHAGGYLGSVIFDRYNMKILVVVEFIFVIFI